MNILLAYTHHRRCGPFFYKRALQQLGYDARSVGPWSDGEPLGTVGREPEWQLPHRYPAHYSWGEIQPVLNGWQWQPDAFLLVEGGENLRVTDVPPDMPWAHISTEGTNLEWSTTPHKFAEIMCNGADRNVVQWLPKAFDAEWHTRGPVSAWDRKYELVQCASARESRRFVWEYVQHHAPYLNVVFGDIWGCLHDQAYQNALLTWVCSGCDFVTTRVFEAMAMGCVVASDRTPSMQMMFDDGKDFIGYDPVPGPGGEGMPHPDWLIATAEYLRKNPDKWVAMSERAYRLVTDRDSYQHRIRTVLELILPT